VEQLVLAVMQRLFSAGRWILLLHLSVRPRFHLDINDSILEV
jgi:hypothetical protein